LFDDKQQVFVAVDIDYKEEDCKQLINELWINHHMIAERTYHEFWIHTWLALYVLNKLRQVLPLALLDFATATCE
jgi:hypothetical protein